MRVSRGFGLGLFERIDESRIAPNKMLLNFCRTRSLGGSKHEIGDSWTPSSASSLQRIGGVDVSVRRSGVLRLIDILSGSPNSRYVKSFVEDAGAALLRPDLPAPSCGCYLRRRSARRPPNGTRHHDFRQRPADGCHGWYRAPASQPLTTPGPSHISNAVRRRRIIRPASRCLRRPSRGRMPCWKDADEPAQTSCLL